MKFIFQTALLGNYEVEIQVHNDEEYTVIDLETGRNVTDSMLPIWHQLAIAEIAAELVKRDQAAYAVAANAKILARKEGEL